MTAPAATLAGYSDTELAEWFAASDGEEWHATLMAEMERRDRADAESARRRQARRNDPLRAEWSCAAHAQYIQAEAATCGNLVRRGSPVTDGWKLWSGPERWARCHATEELLEDPEADDEWN